MITLHHLDFSRSTRVLWLLEELGLDYDLVRYPREVGGPAPAALKDVHPLGTSPVLVDSDLVLAESSAILRYLDREYAEGRFTPTERSERARHDAWLDHAEGSLALPVLVTLRGGRDLPVRLAGKIASLLAKEWQYVAGAVAPGPYLMGSRLTLADMQISYILAISSAAGMLAPFPDLERYFVALMATPALQRAIEKGGPMTGSDRDATLPPDHSVSVKD